MNKKVITSQKKRHELLQTALSNKPTKGTLPVYDLNKIISYEKTQPKTIPQKTEKREIKQQPLRRFSRPITVPSPFAIKNLEEMASTNMQKRILNWLSNNGDWYLGFGGVGDALLVLSACYNNPNAKVVFFHNEPNFTRQWFDLFDVKVLMHSNIMGQPSANKVYDIMTNNPHFKTSGHLADGLNFCDWTANPQKYKERIISYVPWIDLFGKAKFNKPSVVIGPAGSSRNIDRQRYLNYDEYIELVKLYLKKDYIVLVVGSKHNYDLYKIPKHPNCRWIMADGSIDYLGNKKTHTLQDMLAIINGADEIVSVDTWLKTYTLLCGKPTKVIMTRWYDKYKAVGEDASDGVFLNKDIWTNIEVTTIEDLINNLKESEVKTINMFLGEVKFHVDNVIIKEIIC